MLLARSVGGELVEETWRVDGQWIALPEDQSEPLQRRALTYAIDPSAWPTILGQFDAGVDVCACLVEAAVRAPGKTVHPAELGFTREHVPQLLSARVRREAEPSDLTTWMSAFVDGTVQPTAGHLLWRLADLHEQSQAQGPPLQRSLPELGLPAGLVLDWQQLLPDHDQAQLGWTRVVQFTAALIALSDDVVVISVRTEQFDDDVYVQLCREEEGALHLEAVSDSYVEPPLSPDAVDVLHEMGWQDPPGGGLPNYVRFMDAGETAPGAVARLMVDTLRRVYSARPGDRYRFEPQQLVRSLLRGDFGPEFAVSPALSEAQRSRLFLGLRFPHDVGTAT